MENIELGEVMTFKLVSGEEVIVKVVSIKDSTMEISNPLSVAPSHQGMGLVPALFTAEHDKNVTLNTNMVAMWAYTADPIRIKYIEATTGIATASKKIVLG